MNYRDLMAVEKLWGVEYWVENNHAYCCKVLTLRRGFQGSLHYHKRKDETFLIQEGAVRLELADRTLIMMAGDFVRIRPGQPHRFAGLEDSVIIEASTHHDDKDTVRLEDSGPIPA